MISRNIIISAIFLAVCCSIESHNLRNRLEKNSMKRDSVYEKFLENEERYIREPTCTSNTKAISREAKISDLKFNHKRFKRQLTTNNSPRDVNPYGTAAYFSGSLESLRYKGGSTLPKDHFSVGVWIKPEGGQKCNL